MSRKRKAFTKLLSLDIYSQDLSSRNNFGSSSGNYQPGTIDCCCVPEVGLRYSCLLSVIRLKNAPLQVEWRLFT